MESIWWVYISMKNNKSNDIQKNLSSIGIYHFKTALDGWIDTKGNEIWTALNGGDI